MSGIISDQTLLDLEDARIEGRNNLRSQGVECSDDISITEIMNKIEDVKTAYQHLTNGVAHCYIDGTEVVKDYGVLFSKSMDVFCPNATKFTGCFRGTSIEHVYMENVVEMINDGFFGSDILYNSNLKEFIFPEASNNPSGAFIGNNNVVEYLITPNLNVPTLFYANNNILKIVDIYKASNLFGMTSTPAGLEALILRDNINVQALRSVNNINSNVEIYVPEDLLTAYKTATNWSTVENQIFKIEGSKYENLDWFRTEQWYLDYLQYWKNIYGEDVFD